MDASIPNREAMAFKVSANTSEQVFLVFDIHGDLQTFADRGEASADDRRITSYFIKEVASEPRNIGGILSEEKANI